MQRIKYLNTHKEVCSTHANGKTEDSSALLNCAEWRHLGIDSCTQTRCLRIVVVVIRSVAVCARAFNICMCVCVQCAYHKAAYAGRWAGCCGRCSQTPRHPTYSNETI